MCLLFFSYKTSPGYSLVVAANRDEFLVRPTAPLAFLDAEKSILAGQDLEGGGTWLGISRQLKFAALTNYREPAFNRSDAPSRGEILINYLSGEQGAGEYIQDLARVGERYNGFNLIVGDNKDLYYYSNRFGLSESSGNVSPGAEPTLLTPGFYGLSNRLLDDPWPKVVRGKELLRRDMLEREKVDPSRLLDHLQDNHHPIDELLPETGVGLDWERFLSPIFIDGATYGTRSSAVITVTDGGQVDFVEKTWDRSITGRLSSRLKTYRVEAVELPGL